MFKPRNAAAGAASCARPALRTACTRPPGAPSSPSPPPPSIPRRIARRPEHGTRPVPPCDVRYEGRLVRPIRQQPATARASTRPGPDRIELLGGERRPGNAGDSDPACAARDAGGHEAAAAGQLWRARLHLRGRKRRLWAAGKGDGGGGGATAPRPATARARGTPRRLRRLRISP